ncbi:hypothetical protein CPB86DRAFT_518995 [Serendipita vermifera]|nr:hypothetical protein CPB86DRAFT_518995 [Serendipita vermifera]
MIVKRTPSVAAGLAILAHLQTVAAHGFTRGVQGPNGWVSGFDEGTWLYKASGSAVFISDYGEPLYQVGAQEIACGRNPKAAEGALDIEAGQSVSIYWVTHHNENAGTHTAWVHDMGTHRAFIGATGDRCQGTNVNDVQFTELSADYTGPQTYQNGEWPANRLHQDQPWNIQIPNVSPGYYVLRDELTALHFSDCPVGSQKDGRTCGTEFYPMCVCIHVTKGDGSFDMSQANKFPGGYYENENGHV